MEVLLGCAAEFMVVMSISGNAKGSIAIFSDNYSHTTYATRVSLGPAELYFDNRQRITFTVVLSSPSAPIVFTTLSGSTAGVFTELRRLSNVGTSTPYRCARASRSCGDFAVLQLSKRSLKLETSKWFLDG